MRRLLARRRRLRAFTSRVEVFLPPVATPTVHVHSPRRTALVNELIAGGRAPRGDQ